ncbi:MAG: response regulator, partial [Thermoguttaceae bacterium]
ALDAIPSVNPDIVLMDVMMPVMDGITSTRVLTRERGTRVVLISDVSTRDAQLAFEALQAGAVDFLLKPFNREVVRSKTFSVLESQFVAGESSKQTL